jgi:hypothetical protein
VTESKELKLVKKVVAVPAARKVPEKLKMVQAHRLAGLILEHFTEKRMNYSQFAEWASKELGFPVISSQVATRVKEFEVPHGDKPTPPDPSQFTAMLLKHDLEITDVLERLNKLEAWVNMTFPNASGRKAVG